MNRWTTGGVAALAVFGLLGATVHADGQPAPPPEVSSGVVVAVGLPPVPPVAPVPPMPEVSSGVVVAVGLPPVAPVPPVPEVSSGVVVAVGLPPVPPVAAHAARSVDPPGRARRAVAVPAPVVETLTAVGAAIAELARRF